MLGVLKIEEASWFNPTGKKKVVTVSGIPASCICGVPGPAVARESVETLLCLVFTFLRDGGTYGVMVRQSAEMVVYHVDLGMAISWFGVDFVSCRIFFGLWWVP
ncbi:unnamed protein product [Brassica rapa]|uniref:Uncharacterized protein n=1 Tax=Brassica campestris TaxID=3711 RepID=A0A3P6CPT3_BRACM|nr:unnamed protein product [Brassica rapa]VDD17686.1 unnamed protein product [Brassica rapa]